MKLKQVWYVAREDTGGAFPSFFDTKMAAEAYAKYLFPDESESKRYARIYFREVFTMADLNGVLEIARVGLAMRFDEIAKELDLSDEELKRIQADINELLNKE